MKKKLFTITISISFFLFQSLFCGGENSKLTEKTENKKQQNLPLEKFNLSDLENRKKTHLNAHNQNLIKDSSQPSVKFSEKLDYGREKVVIPFYTIQDNKKIAQEAGYVINNTISTCKESEIPYYVHSGLYPPKTFLKQKRVTKLCLYDTKKTHEIILKTNNSTKNPKIKAAAFSIFGMIALLWKDEGCILPKMYLSILSGNEIKNSTKINIEKHIKKTLTIKYPSKMKFALDGRKLKLENEEEDFQVFL